MVQSVVGGQSLVGQGSILGPVLFNIFINHSDDGAGCTHSTFPDDAKPGGAPDMPEGRAATQTDLHRPEKWAGRSLVKFNRGKRKVLCLGRNQPRHQYGLESSFVEKALGVLVDTRLSMGQ